MHLLQTSVTRLYSEPFTSRVVSQSYQTDLLFWVTETGIVGEVFTANRLRMACCEAALCRVDLLGKLPGGRKRCSKRRILKTLLALSLSSWEKWCSCYPAAVLENPWPFHCCPKENPSVCFQLWRNKFFFFILLDKSWREVWILAVISFLFFFSFFWIRCRTLIQVKEWYSCSVLLRPKKGLAGSLISKQYNTYR